MKRLTDLKQCCSKNDKKKPYQLDKFLDNFRDFRFNFKSKACIFIHHNFW